MYVQFASYLLTLFSSKIFLSIKFEYVLVLVCAYLKVVYILYILYNSLIYSYVMKFSYQ